MPDYEKAARFLFDLLDDIDTTSDMAKSNDVAYRAQVERIQRRRFEAAMTDGYVVKFLDEPGKLERTYGG